MAFFKTITVKIDLKEHKIMTDIVVYWLQSIFIV